MSKKKKKQKIDVETFMINRVMGESFDWKKLDIKKKDVEYLNEIGYAGTCKGKKMTVQEYFKKNLDSLSVRYKVELWTTNNMEYTDKLLVTRVTLIK